MRTTFLAALVATAAVWATSAHTQPQPPGQVRPTIVLVHGAFAESSSWNAVVAPLLADGYTVVAAANPLRSIKGDAAYLASLVRSIEGPVILVGHSYGGAVISAAAADADNVTGLVYVAGFALEVGESAADVSARFPEGTLARTLAPPVPQADGGKDLYIQTSRFRTQFAADVPAADAARMAATQRPVTEAALNEPAAAAAWRSLPSWFIYGSVDKNIPSSAHAFMARRARAVETVEVKGASHVVMVSNAGQVARLIRRAATREARAR